MESLADVAQMFTEGSFRICATCWT